MKNNKKGFTLIEMMAVIAIVAVLVAVIIPIMNGSTDKAAAATNASNLRGVEGELVSMMLLDPEVFKASLKNAQQQDIDVEQSWREPGGKALAELEQAAIDTQKAVDDYTPTYNALREAYSAVSGTPSRKQALIDAASHTDCEGNGCDGYKSHSALCIAATDFAAAAIYHDGLGAAAEVAEEEFRVAKENNSARLDELAEIEGGLFKYTAVDGWLIFDDGNVKIEAPASKKVNKDNVDIGEGVQMVVIVNTYDNTFHGYYGEYDKTDFAKVADQD